MMLSVVCTPNATLLDNWFPALKYAKNAHPEWDVAVFFPRVHQIKKLSLSDAVLIGVAGISGHFFVLGLDGRLYRFGNLQRAKQVARLQLMIAAQVLRWSDTPREWPTIDRIEEERRRTSLIWALMRLMLLVLPRSGWLTNRPSRRLLKRLTNSVVCYDTLSQGKRNAAHLFRNYLLGPRLSMRHGLGLVERLSDDAAAELRVERRSLNSDATDYRIYANSESEKAVFVNQLGVHEARVVVTGISRLDSPARAILRSVSSERHEIPWEKTIFFISRSLGNQHADYKRSRIQLVHDFAREYGFGLVLRRHPSESDSEIVRALPQEGEHRTWMLSAAHPQHIAEKAVFAVSFLSSLPVELISFGVPTIELGYGQKNAVISSQERRLGLVLPADSENEFRTVALGLLNDRSAAVVALTKALHMHYSSPEGASRAILADMERLSERVPAHAPARMRGSAA